MKRCLILIQLFVSLLFQEIVFRFLIKETVFSATLITPALTALLLSLLFFLLLQLLKKRKWAVCLILLITGVFFSVQLCLYDMFGFFLEWHLLAGTGQVTGFTTEIFHLIIKNLFGIILLLLPFFISLFIRYEDERTGKKENILLLLGSLLCAGLLVLSFLFVRIEGGNLYQMTIRHNNAETAVRKCGILSHFFIDSGKSLFHVEEEIILVPEEPEVPEEPSPEVPEKVVYEPHVFDIDFDKLIEEDSDTQLKQLDEYFKNARPTYENEYTGYFKGKNLIYIMAESFNEIAVTKELTPTLYRLIHQGFEFKNYYSPTIYSTIGGECQELTGLFFAPRMLGIWKRGTNAFPMGLATVFKEAGYKTYAYHNSDFTFQDRDKYLAALGFDNFTGCGNGLEQKMACKWVASDKDLIDATVDDYTGEEPFMVYYATVSGHGEYWPDHEQAKKYMDLVNEYYGDEVSVTARSYVATQIELDRALQELLLKLEQKGVLEDTVIVLAADHHPYFLDLRYINELSDYERDSSIESQSSSLIIYNPSVPHTEIEKVCGTPDVLPTVYNLFDIPYDSRLMTGKDIFSTEPGFVAFSDWSFVSDKGSFNSVRGVFTPKEGLEVSEEEEDTLWAQVASRFNTSSLILEKNYYAHVIK